MGSSPRILIGTSISGRAGETARREAEAQAALAALANAGDAVCVNLAFVDETPAAGVIPALPVLRLDAPGVSGADGPRKPIVSEMIDALVAEAARRGIGRVALVNGDIAVTRAAVERSVESDRPALAISRTDVGGGAPEALLLFGVDMVVFDAAFWRHERRRFRPYPLGEIVWDNVYAAIIAAHGGVVLNRERLILHERHPVARQASPFAAYVQALAARDSSYFSQWCGYVAAAEALRARGGSADEELALQRTIFAPPGAMAAVADVVRGAWWRARRALARDSVS